MHEQNLRLVSGAAPGELGELPDDSLMLLARANREDAFAVLVRRHQSLVFGLAARYFADRSLGREVSQDVFLSLWADRERYRPRGKFKSYLVSVTFHRCHFVARQIRSHRRKLAGLARESQTQTGGEDLPLELMVEAERAREVRANLALLPGKMREVLILRFTQELQIEEIASLTGKPPGTVKSHLFRGLRRLARLMTGEEP